MPSQLFHDLIDIESETLSAVPLTSENCPISYPYPALKPSGVFQMMTFRTVVIENDFVRYTINLDLGGRIQEILDKRTGIEVLPKLNRLPIAPVGPRGAYLNWGIQWLGDGEFHRSNSLGSVEFVSYEPADDEEPATLILHELIAGVGLSLQVALSLAPNTSELDITLRMMNRTLEPQAAHLGVRMPATNWTRPQATGSYDPARDAGIELVARIEGSVPDGDEQVVSMTQLPLLLAPRQNITWNAVLRPYSGLKKITEVSEGIALGLGERALTLQGSEPGLPITIFLLSQSGETLEMASEIGTKPLTIPLDGTAMNPKSVLVRDAAKRTLLHWQGAAEPVSLPLPDSNQSRSEALRLSLAELQNPSTETEQNLLAATRNVAARATAHLHLGSLALTREDFSSASHHFEQSLLFNGDDPLTWWIAATAKRLAGDTENQELLNAHFLAPLEPALRAESFLAQPQTQTHEPNPILSPISKHPEALLEVASLLLEAGLWVEAGRWIDEALRHQNLPMLRYHQAFLLLTRSRMKAQAQEQVALAEPMVIETPFPWRATEWEVIETLASEFNASERLKRLLSLKPLG